MPFRQIPRQHWSQFLDSFSREHRGCTCSLEVDTAVVGNELEAQASPFQGVTLEDGQQGRAQIQVFVGDRPESHVAHALPAPIAVWIEETDDGSERGLRIEADQGSMLLRFKSPQPSEYVENFLP
jgi:Family of unknown function (DUF5335)